MRVPMPHDDRSPDDTVHPAPAGGPSAIAVESGTTPAGTSEPRFSA